MNMNNENTGTEKLPEYNWKVMERGKSCTVEVAARRVRVTMQIIVYCNNTLPKRYIFSENMIHVSVLILFLPHRSKLQIPWLLWSGFVGFKNIGEKYFVL
jgi:hypothetical protein